MTEKDKIVEGNKLIMEFHDWKLETRHTFDPDHNGGKNDYQVYVKEGRSVRPEDIEFDIVYHLSWDALMPVVEKIESLGGAIQIDEGNIFLHFPMETQKNLVRFNYKEVKTTKIMSVFQACVQFIKWYNSQSSKIKEQ